MAFLVRRGAICHRCYLADSDCSKDFKLTSSIIIVIATLLGKLAYDRHKHFSREKINHTVEGAIVFVLLVTASLIAGRFTDWLTIALALIMYLFIFWALFDLGFGTLIAKDPLFLGTSAKLDRLQHKYPWVVWAKFIGVPVSIILFIYG